MAGGQAETHSCVFQTVLATVGEKRNQTQSVGNKFIRQWTGILDELNLVDTYRGGGGVKEGVHERLTRTTRRLVTNLQTVGTSAMMDRLRLFAYLWSTRRKV